jgi:hypothetical protein
VEVDLWCGGKTASDVEADSEESIESDKLFSLPREKKRKIVESQVFCISPFPSPFAKSGSISKCRIIKTGFLSIYF